MIVPKALRLAQKSMLTKASITMTRKKINNESRFKLRGLFPIGRHAFF